MDKEKAIEAVKKIISARLPDDYKIVLFGSWARGNALETSDIDIGILGKTKVPRDSMVEILRAVEEIPTLREIDVVDLNAKEAGFRNDVLRYAKAL